MLAYIKQVIRPDLIFWTGDNSAHNIWSNSNEEVIAATANVTQMIKDIFQLTNTTVIPLEGNHDVWPANLQDFKKAESNIPINGFAPLWKEWLGEEAAI